MTSKQKAKLLKYVNKRIKKSDSINIFLKSVLDFSKQKASKDCYRKDK